jgi:2-methylcitrate dehydratase PrpD
MHVHQLKVDDIATVTAKVHQAAIDVLGPAANPQTVHQSKFSMGRVLGLIAIKHTADLVNFDQGLHDPEIIAFAQRVTMQFDEEVEQAYPARWLGRVTVTTNDGRLFEGHVDEPKGDPGNTLSRTEIEAKVRRLAAYGLKNMSQAEIDQGISTLIQNVWSLHRLETLPAFRF